MGCFDKTGAQRQRSRSNDNDKANYGYLDSPDWFSSGDSYSRLQHWFSDINAGLLQIKRLETTQERKKSDFLILT